MKAQRGYSCKALVYLEPWSYMEMGERHAAGALPPRNEPVPIPQEPGWTPGLVWMGAENLAHTGIRCPGSPARSESMITE
jgi:hypothetical protein